MSARPQSAQEENGLHLAGSRQQHCSHFAKAGKVQGCFHPPSNFLLNGIRHAVHLPHKDFLYGKWQNRQGSGLLSNCPCPCPLPFSTSSLPIALAIATSMQPVMGGVGHWTTRCVSFISTTSEISRATCLKATAKAEARTIAHSKSPDSNTACAAYCAWLTSLGLDKANRDSMECRIASDAAVELLASSLKGELGTFRGMVQGLGA